jgi:hypothetical protein
MRSDVEQAAVAAVLGYQAARNTWEREAWQRFRRDQGPETDAQIQARFRELVLPYFADPGIGNLSFGDPPSVEPATTEITSVKRRGTTLVVTTAEPMPTYGLMRPFRYTVTPRDGSMRILDIRMVTEAVAMPHTLLYGWRPIASGAPWIFRRVPS